MTKWRWN